MVMIANLQYGWTLFVNPIDQAHGWDRRRSRSPSPYSCSLETWLMPVEGWIVDMLGAHWTEDHGRLRRHLGRLGWVINALRRLLSMLYLGAIISGIGGGAIYGTCVGNGGEMVSGSARSGRRLDRGRLSAPVRRSP